MVVVFRPGEEGFQSTLPVRGATNRLLMGRLSEPISIHAPREGSDRRAVSFYFPGADFNPRSP